METVAVLHAATNGTVVPVTGGFPLRIDAPITLCARSDLDPSRFYNGALANLGIYDSQLSAAQVRAIYQQVRRSERAAPAPFILDSEAQPVAQGQAIIQQVQVEHAEGEIQPFKLVCLIHEVQSSLQALRRGISCFPLYYKLVEYLTGVNTSMFMRGECFNAGEASWAVGSRRSGGHHREHDRSRTSSADGFLHPHKCAHSVPGISLQCACSSALDLLHPDTGCCTQVLQFPAVLLRCGAPESSACGMVCFWTCVQCAVTQ